MIAINLREAGTGIGLGRHQVNEVPETGANFAVQEQGGLIPYKVVDVTILPGEQGLFTHDETWVSVQRQ